MRGTATFVVAIFLLLSGFAALHILPAPSPILQAQGTAPPAPLILITRDARRPVPTTLVSGQELIALDDLASLFQLTVREDALAGGVTITYRGRTIVASADQPMASVNGRVVTLPSAVMRQGRRWLVPIEFVPRALAPIYDQRIDLRRASRLLIVGDVRVPRVVARIDAAGPPTRATVEITPQAGVTVTTEPGRIILRIDADALDVTPIMGTGLIEQIRTGDQANTVTVALLGAAAAPRVNVASADGVTRVSIEVPSAIAPPQDTSAAPRPPSPAPEAVLGAPRGAFQTIVIDPGHGGDDVGVKGAGGLEEKALTLDVARRLRALLESRLGLRVVLTRDDDRAVAPDARAAVANNSKADLFLSLHANSSLAAAMTGAEIYHLKLDQEGEEARRQAAAEAVVLPVLGGGTRSLDVIRWDLAQARHVTQSSRFATMLGEELGRQVKLSPRGVQEAPIRVLEGADMPAALIEMLYLSNPVQEKAAGGDAFRNMLAQGLYDAVTRFRASVEEEPAR